jgi:predicted ATPase
LPRRPTHPSKAQGWRAALALGFVARWGSLGAVHAQNTPKRTRRRVSEAVDVLDTLFHNLRRALQIAEQQEAPSLQLRAARDLARVHAERGERSQAADLLAPIYAWFTEGFDTPDLKEVKALLDELATA